MSGAARAIGVLILLAGLLAMLWLEPPQRPQDAWPKTSVWSAP